MVFTNSDGETVRTINVESVKGRNTEGGLTQTWNTVLVSENQTRAAVLAFTMDMPVTGDEEQLPITQSTISIYSAEKGRIGLVTAPKFHFLFISGSPEKMLFFSGRRLVAGLFQNSFDRIVRLAAYSENGKQLYLGNELFDDIINLEISEDGTHLGALVVRGRAPVFFVVELDTGQIFQRNFNDSTAFPLKRLRSGFRLDFESLPSISLP